MRKHSLYALLLALLCCSVMTAYGQEQPAFSRQVIGYVKDREDRPVLKAKVCANPHSAWKVPIPCGVSKADGRFILDFWHPGTYTISAEKKSAGYPDAHNGFYGQFFGEMPTITVDETSEMKPVEVRVGPKAGRVVFSIVDDGSGQLIKSGAVEVCRTDDPKMCWSMSTGFPNGRYELLTPEVAFTIKFKVWGSDQEWEERHTVEEVSGQVELLDVALGMRKEMNIRLRRLSSGM